VTNSSHSTPSVAPISLPRWVHSIRVKLLLVLVALLAIPWSGYRYVQEIEGLLRDAQELSLLGSARALGARLEEHSDLLRVNALELDPNLLDSVLYAPLVERPLQLDGYDEDWPVSVPALQPRSPDQPTSVRYRLAVRDRHLFVHARIIDDHTVYDVHEPRRDARGDRLVAEIQDTGGELHRYVVSTAAPGKFQVLAQESDRATASDAVWQDMPDGYAIELRMPLPPRGAAVSVHWVDVDTALSASASPERFPRTLSTPGILGNLLYPVPKIQAIVNERGRIRGRLWVVDRQGWVLAAGDLPTQDTDSAAPARHEMLPGLMRLLYRLVLPRPAAVHQQVVGAQLRPAQEQSRAALFGREALSWHATEHSQTDILNIAVPVLGPTDVLGAVIVQQSNEATLLATNEAVARLIDSTLLTMLLSASVVLVFGSILVRRIRRLRWNVYASIGEDGRYRRELPVGTERDELGELAGSVSRAISRLGAYNKYLERFSGRLAHELQTPVAVIRSSLENLAGTDDAHTAQVCTKRAMEGVRRLDATLAAMREATRLEQLVQRPERQCYDLAHVARSAVDGYRDIYCGQCFQQQIPDQSVTVEGDPDLLIQALDKLISNAVDFSTGRAPIVLALRSFDGQATLTVENEGPPLRTEIADTLFDPMVSVRGTNDGKAHLGMGLYIVRLVAEFHGGSVSATNSAARNGARLSLNLPVASDQPETEKPRAESVKNDHSRGSTHFQV